MRFISFASNIGPAAAVPAGPAPAPLSAVKQKRYGLGRVGCRTFGHQINFLGLVVGKNMYLDL